MCDWMITECVFQGQGSGFEFWQLAVIWVAAVVVMGVAGRKGKAK